jgi:hypothetical protein
VDSLFQIKAAGVNVLNVVDSWIDYDTLDLLAAEGPWDLVMWPFQTMRELEVLAPSRAAPAPPALPSEWLEQLQVLKPRFVIPSSCQFQMEPWSWYNHAFFPVTYRQFENEVQAALPETQVVRLNPSVSLCLDRSSLNFAEPLAWVHPVGEQNLDYDYQPALRPPSTAEIARHFPALSGMQKEAVLDYCRRGILEKYQCLEEPEGRYFSKERVWRLSVFDHRGEEQVFFYNVKRNSLTVTSEVPEHQLGWATEVSMSKLFGALNEGESLSSMYVRMNEAVFSSEIEKEIGEADLVEDPLVRCLFNGAFGSYQLAQLKRLLGK